MSEQYVQGMREMRSHFGKAADKWIEVIHDIYPEFAKVNVEFPFGELYRRDVIDTKTRELCTLAALTVQGFALPELKVHILGNLNAGSSRDEILEVITQMIAYCGFPAATNALLAAKEVFDELDSDAGDQEARESQLPALEAEAIRDPQGKSRGGVDVVAIHLLAKPHIRTTPSAMAGVFYWG